MSESAAGKVRCASVLSYYEFKHPMNDRLSDEAWRTLLDSPQRPDRPPWCRPRLHAPQMAPPAGR